MTRRTSTLAVLLAFAACRGAESDGPIVAAGHVEATEVRIATKIGGTLAALPPGEGDKVEPGQLLAQVDPSDLEIALAGAEAERDAAAAALALATAGPSVEEIAGARAEGQALEAETDAAARDLDRFEGLLRSGSGTEKARDDARARRDVARKRHEAASQRVARLLAGTRHEEMRAVTARRDAASARVAQVRKQIEDASIESPLRGTVTERLAEPGEILPPGAPLLLLVDLERPWLTAYVGELDLSRVRLGQAVRVATDDGQEREGKVTYISPVAEFTPRNVQTRDERAKLVYEVKIGLPNQDGLFKPGMPAEARFPEAP